MDKKPNRVRAAGRLGLRWHLAILAVAWAADARSASAVELRIEFTPETRALAGRMVEVAFVRKDGRDSRVIRVWPARAGQVHRVDLPSARWRMQCASPDIFCSAEVDTARAAETERVRVFPATRLAGTLSVPRGTKAPDSVLVQARFGGDPHGLEWIERAPIRDARLAAKLPRTRMDLRIAAPSFVPVYRWGVEARAASLELGTIDLRPGSSLSGRLTGEGIRAGVVVRLRASAGDPGGAAGRRLRLASPTTRSGPAGEFQFRDLVPGRYDLEADAPGSGEPTLLAEGVLVDPDAETPMGALALPPPVTLDVIVEPGGPPAAEGRASASWRVWLRQIRGQVMQRSFVRSSGPDGRVRFDRIPAGAYTLAVEAGEGGRVASRDLDLHADETVRIGLDLLQVHGTLRLGGSPVAGRVMLHDLKGRSGTAAAGTDGAFEMWMQRPETRSLLAQVRLDGSGQEASRPVTLDRVPEGNSLEIDIDLPAFRVAGEVVDETGRPVAGAVVSAASATGSSEATADELGRFDLAPLSEGRHEVVATRSGWAPGSPEVVTLEAAKPSARIRLVLGRGRTLEGWLMSDAGHPVSGVDLRFDWIGHGPHDHPIQTGPDGRFEAVVPDETKRAHVRLVSPPYPPWAACFDLPRPGEELRLTVPTAFGNARVTAGGRSSTPDRLALLSAHGGVLTLADFAQTGRLDEKEPGRVLVDVAVGSYALLETDLSRSRLAGLGCSSTGWGATAWTPVRARETVELEPSTSPER